MQKEEILAEIRRTAKMNGNKPLGRTLFERATGIRECNWQKFWPRFSEAQQEAGLEPNQFKITGYSNDFLMESIISFMRKLKKFPTRPEMRIEKRKNKSFPNDCVFNRRFGNKSQLILQVLSYCQDKTEYNDIISMLESVNMINSDSITNTTVKNDAYYGFVYLAQGHPGEYKIGRANLVDRRISELGTKTSIKPELIHEIKTDDPVGVEAYWHKRFQKKKMRGEWFKLGSDEVKSFKKWRRIY